MLSELVKIGCKISLQAVNDELLNTEESAKVYQSQVYEILSEDRMEVTMPMEKSKLILLPVDKEYDVVFQGERMYQCFARIVDRYKSNNVYLLVLDLTSNLRKYQRREYYRYSCALEMGARPLQIEEKSSLDKEEQLLLQPDIPLKRSVIVDISGGGLRFMSNQRYEPGSLIYCNYHLLIEGKNKTCEIVGKILSVKELENRKGVFEHRVQYVNINDTDREEIIKYIFEEERKKIRNVRK